MVQGDKTALRKRQFMKFTNILIRETAKLKNHIINRILLFLDALFRIVRSKCVDNNIDSLSSRTVKKVLVIHLLRIGDLIVATPAIRAIKEKFPCCRLSLLVLPEVETVLAGNPSVGEIILYKKGDIRAYLKLIRRLRNDGFDIVFSLENTFFSFRYLLIPFLTKSRYRVGFKRKGYRGFLNTHEVKWPAAVKHEAEKYLDLVKALGIEAGNKAFSLYYSKYDDMEARVLLRQNSISVADVLFCIHPGNLNTTKLWRSEGFAVVADELIRKYNAKVIFTGLREEKYIIDEITELMKEKSCNLAGKTNLKVFFALIARSDLLITIDTSSVHIAAALKIPTVVLYGPTNHVVWGPWENEYQIMIKKILPCDPCLTDFGQKFNCVHKNFPCIQQIMPEEVIGAAERLIGKDKNKWCRKIQGYESLNC